MDGGGKDRAVTKSIWPSCGATPMAMANKGWEGRLMGITRRTLIERIDRFIRSIENRTGEPDQWQGHCVKQALVELNAGDVERAEARIVLARTPPQLRRSQIPPAVLLGSRNPTTSELRAEFERIKSQVLH
jgi:hypothetical protein